MVDRPRLTRLMRMTRSDRSLPPAPCELGNVAAAHLAGHMVRIAARLMQPVEEMRESDGVSALGVDRAIALAKLSQKLIA